MNRITRHAATIAAHVALLCAVSGCGLLNRPLLSAGPGNRDQSRSVGSSIDDLQFVQISPGTFLMGSEDANVPESLSSAERPVHTVQLSRPFEISTCEITVGQFRQFVDATGYKTDAEKSGNGCNGLNLKTGDVEQRSDLIWPSPGFEQTDLHPVVCVSWADANAFCNWLSQRTGDVYRLPTEAQWEYACRAGSDTLFCSGDQPAALAEYSNSADRTLRREFELATWAASWYDNYAFTAPVGSFKPNQLGLYDMHGNVGEWCADWFDDHFYAAQASPAPSDPTGPDSGEWRVVRGGSWYNSQISCRSSGRHDGVPTTASTTNGFRVVREIQ